jgi:hypothetical protein
VVHFSTAFSIEKNITPPTEILRKFPWSFASSSEAKPQLVGLRTYIIHNGLGLQEKFEKIYANVIRRENIAKIAHKSKTF